jgi:uncharacterized protein YlxP (DUF503 family)
MEVVFTNSAFRHGYRQQDFYEVLAGDYLKIRSQRGFDEVYELLGRNLNGSHLHVVYRVLPDRRLRVFHMNRHDRGAKAALSEVPTMKKMKRKISRLTRRSTDDEIVRWTKSHDVFDRLETGVSQVVEDHSDLDEVLREAIFQDNTAQLNMRLPPAMKAVLSKLARQRTTDATTLARIWLAERLERELKAG